MRKSELKKIGEVLKNGGVGVMPTDTIYGLVGSAFSKKAVGRIYKLRRRNAKKPFIILIASLSDLRLFGIKIYGKKAKILATVWPGKVSVVFPRKERKFSYLHRGGGSLAFRVPQKVGLKNLLEKTGPLVAPSANLEGKPPAETIHGAKKYFGDKVDFYLNGGKIISKPSTLIEVRGKKIFILRQGAAEIKK